MGEVDGGEEVERRAVGSEEKIFVSVRLRPLNEKEIARNDVLDWECINDTTIIFKNSNLSMHERSMFPTAYNFDRVFRPDNSSRKVYEEGAKEVALSVVSGINSSVFAYGQTSSGKTYTMTGITEYTMADIYDYIQKHTEREFILKFSAMEIYNESVRDLLSEDSSPLRLLDDPEKGTVVEKLTEETLRDWNYLIELLSVCEAQRQIGETLLNETSSRSHQIIRLTVESSAREFLGKGNSSTLVSTLNFVDLAGSERASQSLSAGTRLKEGCHINRSLLTLGTVIRKLSKGRGGHIPFRDSKLTRILQSSLGGNARTAIICTMSPARCHVEQSRNTLLFASCAKEVTTNAQVNVFMSEKALVKHLQRELARLESELRSPSSSFVTSNCTAILQEKDLQIEKLEREVKDLTLERDIAQSQVRDLLKMVGDDGNPLIKVGLGNFPNWRIQRSPEFQNPIPQTSILAHPHSPDGGFKTFDTSRYSDEYRGSFSEDLLVEFPNIKDSHLHNNTSPRLLVTTDFSESDSCLGWEEIEEQSNGASEDLCKEVRCIEMEESITRRHGESNYASFKENIGFSAQMAASIGKRKYQEEDGTVVSPPWRKNRALVSQQMTEDLELVSSPLQEERQLVKPPPKEDRMLMCIHPVAASVPEKPSPWHDLANDSFSSRSLKLTRSRSCKASFMNGLPSSWFQKEENNESTPSNGCEKDFPGRPKGFWRKFSEFNYAAHVEKLSREDSQSSEECDADIVLETKKRKSSIDDIATNINTSTAEKQKTKPGHEMKVADADIPAMEVKLMANTSLKSVKDVGLDPIEDDSKSFSDWPSEFGMLQREIVELWDACNVSLVHRTHFFLLFKGEPTDSIYMEVERRRLSFLRDAFSRGIRTVEDGRALTPASSMKALRHERKMLGRQMQKKLSEQERESLYLKWSIGLNTKNRRLQLAYRLWTETQDMDHIVDSAVVISKLVGFDQQGQVSKEMFRLNFAPRMTRSYSTFRRSLMPLL